LTALARRPFLVLARDERRLLVVAAAVFVLVTADVVMGGPLTHLDRWVYDTLAAHGVREPGILAPLGWLGNVGVGVACGVAVGVVMSQQRWRWWPAVYAVAAIAATELLVLIAKTLVGRAGPGPWATRPGYPGYYPSGHTATAMVLVGVVVHLVLASRSTPGLRARAVTVSVWAGLVAGIGAGLFAVIGGYHWLTDVVAALPVGVGVLVVAGAVVRHRVDAPQSRGDGVSMYQN
jgi:membrane-associated phospholipid phosphatase